MKTAIVITGLLIVINILYLKYINLEEEKYRSK